MHHPHMFSGSLVTACAAFLVLLGGETVSVEGTADSAAIIDRDVAEVTAVAPAPAEAGSDLQREIVASLSDAGATGRLGVRSTRAERAAAAAWLESQFAALGLQPIRHAYSLRNVNALVDLLLSPYRGVNVYAVAPAEVAERPYVIVGAHYDTVPGSPGAVDNASGVALVIELARRVAAWPTRQLNYVFVLFDQEEDDEVGSRAFVRWIGDQGWSVHSVHVADLVGWDSDGDRAVEVQSPGPALERHYRAAADRLAVPLHVTRGASSDNKSFLDAGYPTAGVWEEWDHDDSTPHLHRPSDTFETVDFGFLASTTSLVHEMFLALEREASDAR